MVSCVRSVCLLCFLPYHVQQIKLRHIVLKRTHYVLEMFINVYNFVFVDLCFVCDILYMQHVKTKPCLHHDDVDEHNDDDPSLSNQAAAHAHTGFINGQLTRMKIVVLCIMQNFVC